MLASYDALALVIVLAVLAYLVWKGVKSANANGEGQSATETPNRPVSVTLPERFVVLDLETTGLDPSRHEIIEIGAIRVNRDSDMHDSFSTLIIPKGRISAKITELTGIDRKMVQAEGRDIADVLPAFLDFIAEHRLVAFNADFDIGFLNAALSKAGLPKLTNNVSCALKMAREAWPGKQSYRLGQLCEGAGIQVSAEHRALPDCERALHVYVAASMKLQRA